jgi:hypothetical protein
LIPLSTSEVVGTVRGEKGKVGRFALMSRFLSRLQGFKTVPLHENNVRNTSGLPSAE